MTDTPTLDDMILAVRRAANGAGGVLATMERNAPGASVTLGAKIHSDSLCAALAKLEALRPPPDGSTSADDERERQIRQRWGDDQLSYSGEVVNFLLLRLDSCRLTLSGAQAGLKLRDAEIEQLRKDNSAGLETPLPCDVTIGHMQFGAGVKLRTLVDAATRWLKEAQRERSSVVTNSAAPRWNILSSSS